MERIALPDSWRGRAIVISNADVTDAWFSEGELVYASTLRTPKRVTEWMLSRVAAKQLAIDLHLCASARDCTVDRPMLRLPNGTRYVSISHSGAYAAAAIADEPIGIDVERVRELRPNASHLFLTDVEEAAMREAHLAHRMIHFWAAKEAAWKKLGGAIETLKRVPLKLEAETATGLRFDDVETFAVGELVIALTRPSGAAGSSRR